MAASRRNELLWLLQRRAWVTQQDMLLCGGYRYGARLMELRRLGYRIETKNLSGGKFVYRLWGKA